MDRITNRRTVSLVTSAALITSLTLAAFAAPAAAKPGQQQAEAKQARVEERAQAKLARAEAKEARVAQRAAAKAEREAVKAARKAAKQAGVEKVTVCHKPGTPAEGVLEISASALAAHLAHGDVEGPCAQPAPVAPITCEEPAALDAETSMLVAADEDDGIACEEQPQLLVSIDAPESIEPLEALRLQGLVSGLEASDLGYAWSSTCLTEDALSDPEVVTSEPGTALLVIREGTFTDGTTCDFTLTVTDEPSGASVSATATVEVTEVTEVTPLS